MGGKATPARAWTKNGRGKESEQLQNDYCMDHSQKRARKVDNCSGAVLFCIYSTSLFVILYVQLQLMLALL